MLIGFDGSRAFVKNRTGTEEYSFQILKHLALIDTESKYLVYIRPGNAINKEEWPENFEFKTISNNRLWTQLGLAEETFKDKLDVLFVPSHTIPLIRKPGLKTVMTVHDLGAEYLPRTHQIKQRLYLSFITKWQLKSATRLIAVSKATKSDLVKKVGIDPRKIAVVYESYNEELFKPVSKVTLEDRLKYYDIEYKKYFLFVGTIQPRKNIGRIIEAFASLLSAYSSVISIRPAGERSHEGNFSGPMAHRNDEGDIKLVLAGSKGWLSNEFYELPKKMGIEDSVKFLGRVEEKDLPVLYSGALAFVFPSLFEGFGIPILEAFACGCPVITSNLSSMPEAAGEAAILVNPYSVEEITEALKNISKDSVNLSKKGTKRVKDFSWNNAARETLKVLKEVNSHE